nr:hypothetical protein CTI12_AA443780 [Tanacetum cinerariifolium]
MIRCRLLVGFCERRSFVGWTELPRISPSSKESARSMEKNLEDDAGEILGVHSHDDCDNVTTDDNEDAYLSSNALLDVNHEEEFRGVESDLADSFEEGEIRGNSVLYNDGCIKDCMEKNLEDDAGEILGV